MLATLESFLANTFKSKLNVAQEEEPLYNEQIVLKNGDKQPLIIYDYENYTDVVNAFCNYNEIPDT